MSKRTARTCEKGHKYFKSSDCPTCPICEQECKPQDGFFSILAAPARRALENQGITTLDQISNLSEDQLLKLHGFGPHSIPKLRAALAKNGLTFKCK